MTELELAQKRLRHYLRLYHRATLDDVEITDVPGYWKRKLPCDGQGSCHSPIHWCLGNQGQIRHTISYQDEGRVNGRFASPYRTWRTIKAHQQGTTEQ